MLSGTTQYGGTSGARPVGGGPRASSEIILDDLRKLAQRAAFSDTDPGRLRLVRSISTDLLVAKRFLVCVQTFGHVAAH